MGLRIDKQMSRNNKGFTRWHTRRLHIEKFARSVLFGMCEAISSSKSGVGKSAVIGREHRWQQMIGLVMVSQTSFYVVM
jgi:hypothetical protein